MAPKRRAMVFPSSGGWRESAGSFHLAQPVQAGAFEYLLFRGGASDANDWFLRSELTDPPSVTDPEPAVPAYRPGVAGYVLGPQANLEYGFTAIGNLRSRVGDQGRISNANRDRPDEESWLRVHVDEIDAVGSRFQALDLRIDTLQFGTDVHAYETGNATAHFGLMASVGESRTTFFDPARAVAGLPTRPATPRPTSKARGVLDRPPNERGLLGCGRAAASLSQPLSRYRSRDGQSERMGRHLVGGDRRAVRPRRDELARRAAASVAYQRLELDHFTDEVGAVARTKDDALRARAGLQLFRAPAKWLGLDDASPFVAVGAQRDFGDAASAVVGNTAIREQLPDTTADVSLGFTGSVRPGIALHLDVRYQQSTEGEERDGVRANFGFG